MKAPTDQPIYIAPMRTDKGRFVTQPDLPILYTEEALTKLCQQYPDHTMGQHGRILTVWYIPAEEDV